MKNHPPSLSSSHSTNQQHQKSVSVFAYFKFAAKRVFGILLLRRRKTSLKVSTNLSATSNSSASNPKSSGSFGFSGIADGQIGVLCFSAEEIWKATNNFSQDNVIGEGGFGTVYKGRLKNGSMVAVKRAKKNTHDKYLTLEFNNEILTLSKIEHLNLVKLYGYLEHGDELIIVVEYITNGTLREHLDGAKGNGLEIAERLDIAIDIAHAVTYLHMYTDPPIIHRDIKASNILITEKLRAKVADFGFARLTEDSCVTHISTQVKGTAGYLDPEYLRTYQLTEKSDVYSFGVLLVEIMTGREPLEPKKPLKERVTIRWAMQRLKEGVAVVTMDPRLRRTPASNIAVEKVLKLAQQCLGPVRQSRPSMRKCAEVLWEIRKDFRERAMAPAPSTSRHSANYPARDARKTRQTSFGIEDGESYEFISV